MELVLLQLVEKYPWLVSIILAVGTFRMVLKPIFAAARYYVEQTADPEDDKKLNDIEQSKPVQFLFFILDWLASVKIKK
jgi:hypothetical protein